MHHPTVGAGLPAMAPVQVPQNFPTSLSGCPSERVPLTFVSRCQFSDRDCKPAEIMLELISAAIIVALFMVIALWWLCAGDLWVYPGCSFLGLAGPHTAATHHLQVMLVVPIF